MMDGVSTMDTGNNGQMLQMNVEAIAEVKVLTSGYQAEYGRSSGLQITAVTKSGTNQFRGSLYDVERNSDWNENSWANVKNGVPKTIQKERDWAIRSAGRSASRAAATSCSSSTATSTARGRAAARSTGSACRPRPSAPATSRSRPIRTAHPIPNLFDSRHNGGAVSRQGDPADRLYQPGLAILNLWPLPNTTGLNYNYEVDAADGEHADPAACHPPRLPADVELARHRQVRRPDAQRRSELDRRGGRARRRHSHPRIQRLRGALSVDRHDLGDHQLHAEQHDVPRGDLRVGAEPARLDDHHRRLEPLQCRPRRSAAPLQRRRRDRSPLLREQAARGVGDAVLPGWPGLAAADVCVRQSRRQRAAEPRLPRVHEHQPDAGLLDQPDQDCRAGIR